MTENKSGETFWFIFGILFVLFLIPQFIHGEIIYGKYVRSLTAAEARCVAAFFIFSFLAMGPYFYIRNAFKKTKAGGILLCLGIVVGYTITALASLHFPNLLAIGVGDLTTLLSLIPGFIVCRRAEKKGKQTGDGYQSTDQPVNQQANKGTF